MDEPRDVFLLESNATSCNSLGSVTPSLTASLISFANFWKNPEPFQDAYIKLKVNPLSESTIFFELIEIFQTFNIGEYFLPKPKINIAQITHNNNSTNYLFNILREENEDNSMCCNFEFNNLYNMFIKNNFNIYKHPGNNFIIIIFNFCLN